MWHEPEEAAIIDIVQSSNLIIYSQLQLSFKLILSRTWEWCHSVSPYTSHMCTKKKKTKPVSTEIVYVKIWMDVLDGFHVQIIHNSIGKGGIKVILGWNLFTALGLSEFLFQLVRIEEKQVKVHGIIYWALSNSREFGSSYGLLLCLVYTDSSTTVKVHQNIYFA